VLHCHRALGPGLLETIYARALGLELSANAIPFEDQKKCPVLYRDQVLCFQRTIFWWTKGLWSRSRQSIVSGRFITRGF
jgi:hypothetical protein